MMTEMLQLQVTTDIVGAVNRNEEDGMSELVLHLGCPSLFVVQFKAVYTSSRDARCLSAMFSHGHSRTGLDRCCAPRDTDMGA